MKRSTLLSGLLLAISAITVYSCKKDVKTTDTGATATPNLPATSYEYYSEHQFVTDNQNEVTTLGRVLFYDRHLSLNNAVSCAGCHKQAFAFADDAAFSRGFENRLTGRNSMPIQNLSFTFNGKRVGMAPNFGESALFWDGREQILQNLVARPLTNHIEMGIDDPNVLPEKLARLPYYKKLFMDAYGDEQITFDRMSESIAFFLASVKVVNTKFDKSVRHELELTALEQEGLNLFNSKYDCASCHRVDTMGYQSAAFADIGLAVANNDLGKGAASGVAWENNMFKLPNLRNVALTAPYMHDGRFGTLEDVLEHYSSGIANTPNLDERLRDMNGQPMRMNISDNERTALVAFLHTLTDYDMVTDPKYSDPFKK